MFRRDQAITSRNVGPVLLEVYPFTGPDFAFDSSDPPYNTAYLKPATFYGDSSLVASDRNSDLPTRTHSSRKRRGQPVKRSNRVGGVPKNWNSFFHHKTVVEEDSVGSVRQPIILMGTVTPTFAGCAVCRDLNATNWCEHYGDVGRFDKDLPTFYDESPDEVTINVNSVDLDALVQRSLREMLPQVRTEVSTLNFIREFEEIFSLFHFAGDLHHKFGLLKGKIKDLVKGIKSSSELTWKEVTRLAAEGHLEWSFNIKPLLSDVRSFYDAYRTLASDLSKGANVRSGIRTKYFTYVWNEYDDSDTGFEVAYRAIGPESAYGMPYTRLATRRKVTYFPSEFHAQIQYNANYTYFQAQYPELLAFLDKIGVMFNPRIIWDALPWTFVVDWFADIGQLLDRAKVQHMAPDINILQYSWSLLRERKISVSFHDYGAGVDSNPTTYPLAYYHYPTVRETVYRRSVGIPGVVIRSIMGELGLRQYTLGVSLAITHRRSRFRLRGN